MKPILFSTPMVKAILEGRKTLTRRVCKQIMSWTHQENREARLHDGEWYEFMIGATMPYAKLKSPYGEVGDVLWVRETTTQILPDGPYYYKADIPNVNIAALDAKWKPSIFMPKTACRIFLEIISIKCERLKDISEADAIFEGIEQYVYSGKTSYCAYKDYLGRVPKSEDDILNAVNSYLSLWENINGKESLETNPWVWVIEFKRIESPIKK